MAQILAEDLVNVPQKESEEITPERSEVQIPNLRERMVGFIIWVMR